MFPQNFHREITAENNVSVKNFLAHLAVEKKKQTNRGMEKLWNWNPIVYKWKIDQCICGRRIYTFEVVMKNLDNNTSFQLTLRVQFKVHSWKLKLEETELVKVMDALF